MSKISPHFRAVLQALFVTFLWSTSWVLIKFGLEEMPPLVFAGLRYMLAFLVLLPFLWRQPDANPAVNRIPSSVKSLTRGDWWRLIVLGVVFYALTQGAVFVALAYAPAVSVTLILSFTAVFVALKSQFFLKLQMRLFNAPAHKGSQ